MPKQPRQEIVPREGLAAKAGPNWQRLAGTAVIAIAIVVIYLPAIHGGFILDDNLLLTANRLIRAPDGLYQIWFTTAPDDYWPLTNTTFWLEWRLWGMNPTGYHVTNLLLHFAASLLLWAILRSLVIPGAWLAAFLFAIHPLNVESVAWISQRKNTLSMVFFLLSILLYLKDDQQSIGRYLLSLLFFLLAMLSKGSVATLPILLLLIVWWRRQRLERADLLRIVPFFAVALVLAIVNIWFQTHGSGEAIRDVSLLQRVLGAAGAFWFYLWKALLPVDLLFVYPRWNVDASDWRWWLPAIGVLFTTGALTSQRNTWWGRPLLIAWLCYGAALLPAVGLIDVGYMRFSLVANRYAHIAMIPVLALLAAAWTIGYSKAGATVRSGFVLAAVGACGFLGALSWRENHLFADAITLYETTLKKNPDSALLHNNLGRALRREGRIHEALDHYRRALSIDPDSALAHYNIANSLTDLGQVAEAVQHYEQALAIFPEYPEAMINLGGLYARAGRLREAIAQFERALTLEPDSTEAHFNLAKALSASGRFDDAIKHYQTAARLLPDNAQVHWNLAMAYANVNRPEDAVAIATHAVVVAHSSGQKELAQQIGSWMKRYRENISNGSHTPAR